MVNSELQLFKMFQELQKTIVKQQGMIEQLLRMQAQQQIAATPANAAVHAQQPQAATTAAPVNTSMETTPTEPSAEKHSTENNSNNNAVTGDGHERNRRRQWRQQEGLEGVAAVAGNEREEGQLRGDQIPSTIEIEASSLDGSGNNSSSNDLDTATTITLSTFDDYPSSSAAIAPSTRTRTNEREASLNPPLPPTRRPPSDRPEQLQQTEPPNTNEEQQPKKRTTSRPRPGLLRGALSISVLNMAKALREEEEKEAERERQRRRDQEKSQKKKKKKSSPNVSKRNAESRREKKKKKHNDSNGDDQENNDDEKEEQEEEEEEEEQDTRKQEQEGTNHRQVDRTASDVAVIGVNVGESDARRERRKGERTKTPTREKRTKTPTGRGERTTTPKQNTRAGGDQEDGNHRQRQATTNNKENGPMAATAKNKTRKTKDKTQRHPNKTAADTEFSWNATHLNGPRFLRPPSGGKPTIRATHGPQTVLTSFTPSSRIHYNDHHRQNKTNGKKNGNAHQKTRLAPYLDRDREQIPANRFDSEAAVVLQSTQAGLAPYLDRDREQIPANRFESEAAVVLQSTQAATSSQPEPTTSITGNSGNEPQQAKGVPLHNEGFFRLLSPASSFGVRMHSTSSRGGDLSSSERQTQEDNMSAIPTFIETDQTNKEDPAHKPHTGSERPRTDGQGRNNGGLNQQQQLKPARPNTPLGYFFDKNKIWINTAGSGAYPSRDALTLSTPTTADLSADPSFSSSNVMSSVEDAGRKVGNSNLKSTGLDQAAATRHDDHKESGDETSWTEISMPKEESPPIQNNNNNNPRPKEPAQATPATDASRDGSEAFVLLDEDEEDEDDVSELLRQHNNDHRLATRNMTTTEWYNAMRTSSNGLADRGNPEPRNTRAGFRSCLAGQVLDREVELQQQQQDRNNNRAGFQSSLPGKVLENDVELPQEQKQDPSPRVGFRSPLPGHVLGREVELLQQSETRKKRAPKPTNPMLTRVDATSKAPTVKADPITIQTGQHEKKTTRKEIPMKEMIKAVEKEDERIDDSRAEPSQTGTEKANKQNVSTAEREVIDPEMLLQLQKLSAPPSETLTEASVTESRDYSSTGSSLTKRPDAPNTTSKHQGKPRNMIVIPKSDPQARPQNPPQHVRNRSGPLQTAVLSPPLHRTTGDFPLGRQTHSSAEYHLDYGLVYDAEGYSGTFTGSLSRRSDLPHGQGVMLYDPHQSQDAEKYEGAWVEGSWHGKGRVQYLNGDCYEGDLKHGMRQGRGTLQYGPNNSSKKKVYQGEFKGDKPHGQGTLRYGCHESESCSQYTGTFFNGKCHGSGRADFPDGHYEGEWRNNMYWGKGKCVWADGRVYEGDFVKNRSHGYGKETYPDGTVRHEGLWENNKPVREEAKTN